MDSKNQTAAMILLTISAAHSFERSAAGDFGIAPCLTKEANALTFAEVGLITLRADHVVTSAAFRRGR